MTRSPPTLPPLRLLPLLGRRGRGRFCLAALALCCSTLAAAQQAPSGAAGAASAPAAAAPAQGLPSAAAPALPQAPSASASASVPASAVATAVSSAVSSAGAGANCASVTDNAGAADLRAAKAQAERADAKTQAGWVDQAIGHWQQAVQLCEGRARSRAERNLADTQQQRAKLSEMLGSGEGCASSAGQAQSLQDLARQALTERRWADATSLFRKAEGQWDLASERCAGGQQQQALLSRDQVVLDGHNAEHCAPVFDRARAFTQRHRNAVAALQPAERQGQQQMAETLWRDASSNCKGPALELTRSNAQTFARERGTPWVSTYPPDGVAARAPAPAVPVAGVGAVAAGPPTAAPPALRSAAAVPIAGVGANAGASAAVPVAFASLAPAPALPLVQALSGGGSMKGDFKPSADGKSLTGQGVIEWANGDRFEGSVRDGRRQGKGSFEWKNGQRYEGDWVDDEPQGRGLLRFVNGDIYEGELRAGVPLGQGLLRYASGDEYRGSVEQGTPHGVGIYQWANGQTYDGPFVRGVASGSARMRFASGSRFEGHVIEGKPQGQGKTSFVSGDVYEGLHRDGQPHGAGVYRWRDGQRYEGPWVDGQPSGKGQLQFVNGNHYEGELLEGRPQGQGSLRYASGDLYVGSFDKGLAHGMGRYRWKNGSVHQGQWRAGKKEGPGVLEWPSGERWEGLFKDDQQVLAMLEPVAGTVPGADPTDAGKKPEPSGDKNARPR